jgi:hypothetical protein
MARLKGPTSLPVDMFLVAIVSYGKNTLILVNFFFSFFRRDFGITIWERTNFQPPSDGGLTAPLRHMAF